MTWLDDILYRIRKHLVHIEKIFAALSLATLLALSLLQVILRNFFDLGFSEIDIVSRHLVLFVTFMGAALVSEGNRHIKIDCVSAAIRQSRRDRIRKPLQLFSSIVCAIFSWHAVRFWLDEKAFAPDNEQLALYLALILPAGFFILSLHFFLLFMSKDNQQAI